MDFIDRSFCEPSVNHCVKRYWIEYQVNKYGLRDFVRLPALNSRGDFANQFFLEWFEQIDSEKRKFPDKVFVIFFSWYPKVE